MKWHILKNNSTNLLHTGNDKNADKWIDDIRWTVMVFDATFVCENILRSHQSGVNRQQHPFLPTSLVIKSIDIGLLKKITWDYFSRYMDKLYTFVFSRVIHKINSTCSLTCLVKSNVTNLNIGLNLLGVFCHMPPIIYMIKLNLSMWLDSLFYLLSKGISHLKIDWEIIKLCPY